jgi:hypothetical protein
MRITKDGNIGIGTTNPPASVTIQTSTSSLGTTSELGLLINNNGATGKFSQIGFGYSEATTGAVIGGEIESGAGATKSSLVFGTRGTTSGSDAPAERMRITSEGDVGIGTTDPQGYKLAVNGSMIAESVKVKLHANWPDHVFSKSYKLPDLKETEKFINENSHLPEIPSAVEVEKDGINLGEMNSKLLQKIEELTLYLIDQNKEIKELKSEINQLKSKP